MEHDVEDVDFTLNIESSENESTVMPMHTTFRALNEEEQRMRAKNGKFEWLEKASNDSEIDEDY